MSDYYEHVQRPVLWERADKTHFPLSILAVVLNQHQAPRFVSYEGATVPAGHPGQGLAAGDPFDTYLVQVYTLEPLDAWQSKHRRLPLSLFIDDFQVGITDDDPEIVVGELTAGAEALAKVIENDLGCTVACRKSITLANSDGLRKKLAKALGSKAGQVAPSGKNLGVDFAVGNLRCRRLSRPVLKQRMQKLQSRKRRLAALRRAGTDMRKLFASGLNAYGTYGVEVTG
eukprot:5131100-Pyramimonas_sp.AAC.1